MFYGIVLLINISFLCTHSYVQNSINYKNIKGTVKFRKTRNSFKQAWLSSLLHSRKANCYYYPLESHLTFLILTVKVNAFWWVTQTLFWQSGWKDGWHFMGLRINPLGNFRGVAGVVPFPFSDFYLVSGN